MVYKDFRLLCTLRILFLCATACLFFYLLLETAYYATLLTVGGAGLYQTYALIHYVERTNRDLTRFLQAIRYEDFAQSFTGAGLGASFNTLQTAFNSVLDAFRKTRAEKEEHYRYLQTVVQHVGVGLLCFQPDGTIELINSAAQRLLGTGTIPGIAALQSFSPPLADALLRLRSGEKTLVKVENGGDPLHLVVSATELRMRNQAYTLVSIHNIQSELEEKEMEAWQNLIRVLTHEIMNSITPVSSLASTAHDLLQSSGLTAPPAPDVIRDVSDAVRTIQRRSQGLLHFVETYRKLTRIPKPGFRIFPVSELFAGVDRLMRAEMEEQHIDLRIHVEPKTLELTADPELIEQVLLNLLINAVHALKNRPAPRIDLTARMDGRGRPLIRVRDNGPGILDEVQEKIFIPFFTTKRDGSGIGLSLCRQIMRLHRGSIGVVSRPEEETVFTLRF